MDAIRHYCRSLGGSFQVVLDHEVDEMTLKRVKSKNEPDIYVTFSFQYQVNLRAPIAPRQPQPLARRA
jgi:hypothetical protein